ncbi:MAG TPA: hypothetical protein VFQ76_06380 [Longimicrobiaceae bacterium]|nr:hypothetical protein [Longimicrobiaceae bacterium]
MRDMRIVPTVVALCGVALLAFGFWGTHGGAARFGDGFVPIAASAAGGLLLIAGAVIDMAAERRRRKAAKA